MPGPADDVDDDDLDDDHDEDEGEGEPDALRAAWQRQWAMDAQVHGFDLFDGLIDVESSPLAECASDEEIAAFEQASGVFLPREYRDFIAEVSNGCDIGPYGAIVPLGLVFEMSGGGSRPMTTEELAALARPFRGARDDDEDEDEDAPIDDGALPLSPQGCGECAYLVLNGQHRGEVWEVSASGWCPVPTPLVRRVTFREWFAAWLITTPPDAASSN